MDWPLGLGPASRSTVAFMPISPSASSTGAGSPRRCCTSRRRFIRSKSIRSIPSTLPRRLRISASSVGQSMLVITKRVVLPLAAGANDTTGLPQGPHPASVPAPVSVGIAAAVASPAPLNRACMPIAFNCSRIPSGDGKVCTTDSRCAGRSNSKDSTASSGSSLARMAASSLRQSMLGIVNTSVFVALLVPQAVAQEEPQASSRPPASVSRTAFIPISVKA